jgi:hypothetical protein
MSPRKPMYRVGMTLPPLPRQKNFCTLLNRRKAIPSSSPARRYRGGHRHIMFCNQEV